MDDLVDLVLGSRVTEIDVDGTVIFDGRIDEWLTPEQVAAFIAEEGRT